MVVQVPWLWGQQPAPRPNLTGCTLLAGTCEKSHSETLPAHLGSVLGGHDPGQMGIATWRESVHLCRVKTDISVLLTDMSGPDSHMIRIWLIIGQCRRIYGLRWLPHALVGWLSRALIWGCYLRLLFWVATPWLMLRLLPRLYDDNKNVILTLLINGWDLSLILVIRLQ